MMKGMSNRPKIQCLHVRTNIATTIAKSATATTTRLLLL